MSEAKYLAWITVNIKPGLFLMNFLILSSSYVLQNMSQHQQRWQGQPPRAGLISAAAGLPSKYRLQFGHP